MVGQRWLGLSIVSLLLVAALGCTSKDAQVADGAPQQPGDQIGQTPDDVDLVDPSFAGDQDEQETPGLAPSSPDGSQLPGLVNSNGYIGDIPLQFPNGQLPQSLLPGYQYRLPVFPPQIMKFFLCVPIVYNTSGTVLSLLVEKWNFIVSLFIKLAGRLPRPSEILQAVRALANPDSEPDRQQAASLRIYDEEHLGPLVNILYNTFLGRDAEPSGKQYWINRLKSGTTYEGVVIEIAASQERKNRMGARTVSALINALILDNYAKILGRQASSRGTRSERGYWFRYVQNQRRAGKSLAEAITMMTSGIVKSDENRWKVAEHMTKKVLEDAATWSLINTAFQKLKASDGNLLETMKWAFGTNEYYQKNKRRFVSQLTQQWCEDNAGAFLDQWF